MGSALEPNTGCSTSRTQADPSKIRFLMVTLWEFNITTCKITNFNGKVHYITWSLAGISTSYHHISPPWCVLIYIYIYIYIHTHSPFNPNTSHQSSIPLKKNLIFWWVNFHKNQNLHAPWKFRWTQGPRSAICRERLARSSHRTSRMVGRNSSPDTRQMFPWNRWDWWQNYGNPWWTMAKMMIMLSLLGCSHTQFWW